jgi:(p)ppGpp synthase/HD superfamily hydrolase
MDELLGNSIEFAFSAHSGQKRKTGEDLINHLIRVKNYLIEAEIKDEKVLAAAMLHDILKSTDYNIKDIEREFGKDIAYLVERLDKISSIQLPLDDDPTNHKDLHKLLFNLSQDMQVLIIRLADRIDNLKTCQNFPLKDQIWIAKKALAIYAPISDSIGLHTYYRAFTRESFRILNPKRYYNVNFWLTRRHNSRPARSGFAITNSKLLF